ncbi:hypothetical protein CAC42_2882 [Sphaceloma murrayae]|uniref:Uncharacterized protein n=1 Tax=Sphaceloma murrayae TaxID=2082308 RepID=A0A2K1R0W7_9PEZI|nr:hypothetical protein CAC42_2882 [Sphaceloma murrayae]
MLSGNRLHLCLLVAILPSVLAQDDTCQSFGIDFQDEGSYFQNISSADPFTFVSAFEGCQAGLAQNLLVDPAGDELLCTDTSLTPDNVNQLSTCPILKNQLTSGEWSVLVISNNGNGSAFAYERDLYLTVGVPVTITSTPTVTITATAKATINSTITISETDTTTVSTTTTVPRFVVSPTRTMRHRTVVTTTKTLGTVSKTSRTVQPVYMTVTETASCVIPTHKTDKPCRVTPTRIVAMALMTDGPHAKRFHPVYERGVPADRMLNIREVPVNREQRLFERKERLAAARRREKRSPDSATVTIVDSNTANYPIVTSTVTSGTETLTVTTAVTSTATVTHTETVLRGVSKMPVVTVTGEPRTMTRWHFTRPTEFVTTRTFVRTQRPPTSTPTSTHVVPA